MIKEFMTFQSLPYEPRKIEATEQRLGQIYDAARRGLKGDALALACDMMPIEYRRLIQLDPVAEYYETKGRADGEMEMAGVLRNAALAGDAKAALDILKHVHGWVAKQAVSVEVNQTISITAALQEAQQRVIEGQLIDASANILPGGGTASYGDFMVAADKERPAVVREAGVSLGESRDAS